MTKVSAITCPECGYTIFSRAHHDFRYCFCGKVAIDGGRTYTRTLYPSDWKNPPEPKLVEIPQSEKELYDDWNYMENKFGWIEPNFNEGKNDG